MRFSHWLRPLAARLNRTAPRRPLRRPAFRPRVEGLEDRSVPAVFTVSTTADSGAGSLRQAILDANATPGADTITFAIPDALKSTAGSWWTIQLQAGLPTVTDTVAIDGRTQGGSGYGGPPLIEIRGLGGPPTPGMDGLTFGTGSAGSSVRGLVLNNFGDTYYAGGNTAIHLAGPGATGIVIAGNYIGTDPTGTQPVWNGPGIVIDGGASGNTVGGTTTVDRNVISGNLGSAVIITGTDPLTGTPTRQNVIAGNYIGTDVSGLAAVPNTAPNGFGVVRIAGGASDNLIGGSAPGAGNLISGNNNTLYTDVGHWGDGIGINGVGTDRNRVQGNLIGTDRTGNAALPNYWHGSGLYIWNGARYNVIGTDGDGVNDGSEGNIISGNLYDGIDILDPGTKFNVVAGNLIGLGRDGSTPLGNSVGVGILGGATGNRIGTNADGVSDELERNIISSSRYDGVSIGNGDGTSGNVVAGNYIGTDKTGLLARGNDVSRIGGDPFVRGGVLLLGAGSNRIGGTTEVERNVISGNGYGVVLESISGRGTSGVQLLGNYIGTDKTGAPVLGNGVGVYLLDGSTNNVIGGSVPGAGNLIAGNTRPGVLIQGDTSAANAVLGNSIFANGGLGIDLGGNFANNTDNGDGVTPNDPLDADTGPNGLQNYPLIASAARTAAGTAISGTLNSTPGTQFRLEFFASDALDAAGNVEGKTYLGFLNVATDADGNATFTATLAAAPPGQQYMSATATRLDASGNPTDTSEFTPLPQSQVLPANTPPVANAGGPYTVVRGGTVVLDASGTTDLEQPNTTLLYEWDFDGDGQYDDATGMHPTFSADGLNSPETRTIGLHVTDGGGLSATATTTVQVVVAAVLPDPTYPGQQSLFVGGTTGRDTIVVSPSATAGAVDVQINGQLVGTYSPSGRIVVYAQAGDDDVQVAGSISLPCWLFGGDGNDRLKGGNGSNVLEGGAGDDLLGGGGGRDLLVGGGGADRLIGNGGDDILIGGTTAFDADNAALAAIMAEWTSAHDYATRVANLTDQTTSAGFLSRLNGVYFLLDQGSGQTVFNDSSTDTLTGSAGSDWFFAGTADKVTDLSDSDRLFIFGP